MAMDTHAHIHKTYIPDCDCCQYALWMCAHTDPRRARAAATYCGPCSVPHSYFGKNTWFVERVWVAVGERERR